MTKKLSPEVKALKKAKKILEENKWLREGLAAKANGRTEVNPLDPAAKCFCALGAVARATRHNPEEYYILSTAKNLYDSAEYWLNKVVEQTYQQPEYYSYESRYMSIDEYNDYVAKSKKDVLKMFDRAIELAKEKQ